MLGIAAAAILLAVAGLLLAYRAIEQCYGLSPAPEVSHEVFATNEDRVRLVIRPEFLLPYLEHYLPKEEASATGPTTAELFRELLPREIAVLARSDLSTEKIHLMLFANEKRGGSYIQTRINNANVLAQLSGIEWITDGLELCEKGCLVAEGVLPLPPFMKEARLEHWPVQRQDSPDVINKGHFAELTVENSNGEMLTLFAIVAALAEEDWRSILGFLFIAPLLGHYGPPPSTAIFYEVAVSNILPKLNAIHVAVDTENKDNVTLSLFIDVDAENGPYLVPILSTITFPGLRLWLKDNPNLALEGSLKWDETESHIVGTYTLSGIQPILEDIIGSSSTLFRDNDAMFNLVYRLNTLFQN